MRHLEAIQANLQNAGEVVVIIEDVLLIPGVHSEDHHTNRIGLERRNRENNVSPDIRANGGWAADCLPLPVVLNLHIRVSDTHPVNPMHDFGEGLEDDSIDLLFTRETDFQPTRVFVPFGVLPAMPLAPSLCRPIAIDSAIGVEVLCRARSCGPRPRAFQGEINRTQRKLEVRPGSVRLGRQKSHSSDPRRSPLLTPLDRGQCLADGTHQEDQRESNRSQLA